MMMIDSVWNDILITEMDEVFFKKCVKNDCGPIPWEVLTYVPLNHIEPLQ